MLLSRCFLLAGFFCHNFAAPPLVQVVQDAVATLPCPRPGGHVTWSRYRQGQKVTLVTITNGEESGGDKRYRSLADHSLVIVKVKLSDSSLYDCNGERVYLQVTTEPGTAAPGTAPPGRGGVDGPGSDREEEGEEEAAAEDQQAPTDIWKIPVGAVIGATLVLSAVVTLRFCSKKRAERSTDPDRTVAETIYEEIEICSGQPGAESDVECPYYWTSIVETSGSSPSTPTADNLYATVNKLRAEGSSDDECVYSLAQSPSHTGSD